MFTRANVPGYIERGIERDYLKDYISDFSQQFYLCEKNEFVKIFAGYLEDLNANTESIFIALQIIP
ncbi:ferredoxin reductase domain-containing protein [Flavobacterium caseinilyticum]|uniref:Uncharacterized protein n=1 Tax=Flavobacterium caseinilyticum TaxID=2541732 RepID=A0A4R5AV58_9FLAO|nr:hypothetical protein [Flavobacterium caseinilyticum]TDD76971.1 hypothetical protein E0F89_05060 [Flavobacterium caseinilyticum]